MTNMFAFLFVDLYRQLAEVPHVIWMDNFSKTYIRKVPNFEHKNSAWHDCLWTGVALKKWEGDATITSLEVTRENGTIIPAMPDTLFDPALLSKLATWVKFTDAKGMFLYDSSISKYATRTPVEVDPVTEPDLFATMKRRQHGLGNLYPIELQQHNIGDKRGFTRVFRKYLNEVLNSRPKRYSVVMADVDIFPKILKV
jgi:hypothetical protein